MFYVQLCLTSFMSKYNTTMGKITFPFLVCVYVLYMYIIYIYIYGHSKSLEYIYYPKFPTIPYCKFSNLSFKTCEKCESFFGPNYNE